MPKTINVKALIEKRNSLLIKCDELIQRAAEEVRAFTAEEETTYNNTLAEIESLGRTIEAVQTSMARGQRAAGSDGESAEQQEARAFDQFLRTGRRPTELRADNDMQTSENTAIIPTSIANRIIEEVKELSPIYQRATKINAKGTLVFPVWGKGGDDTITCTYADEGTEPDTHTGKFTGIELKGHLFSAQVKIPKTLIHNAAFDVVAFVVKKIAEAVAEFYERECILGTAGKMTGVISAEVGVTAASETAITADEVIDLQASIKEPLQTNAEFLMNKKTLTGLRKLKDNTGAYLLTRSLTAAFGWELLGKNVMISENMPEMAAGNVAIVYGDFSGLYIKTAEEPTMQVLNELYAKQHAVGISLFGESDAKIVEAQKLRTLKMAAADEGEETA